MGYIEENNLFICGSEHDSGYEVVVNDDFTMGNVHIYLRKTDTKEFVGSVCNLGCYGNGFGPEVSIYKSYKTGTDENSMHDIRFEYELPNN